MIHVVPMHLVPALWGAAEPHFDRALKWHPFLDAEGLRQRILGGLADLVLVVEGERVAGALALEEFQYPKQKVGNVLALGGDIGSMAKHGEEVAAFLDAWRVRRSLDSLGTLGRPGWSRVLKRFGWRTQPMCVAWK